VNSSGRNHASREILDAKRHLVGRWFLCFNVFRYAYQTMAQMSTIDHRDFSKNLPVAVKKCIIMLNRQQNRTPRHTNAFMEL